MSGTLESNSYINDNASSQMFSLCSTRCAGGIQLTSGSSWADQGYFPTKIKWKLYKTGSPTGNLTCRIYDKDFVLKLTSTTSLDMSTITSNTNYEFIFDGSADLDSEDVICLYVDNTSGSDCSSAFVTCYKSNYDESSIFEMIEGNCSTPAWTSTDPHNPYIQITYTSGTPTSTGTRLPPPPLIARF